MTTTKTVYELHCDTCGCFLSAGKTELEAIGRARTNGDAVDTDYTPCKVMCAFCKLEWMKRDTREMPANPCGARYTMSKDITVTRVKRLIGERRVWAEVPAWGWLPISNVRVINHTPQVQSLQSQEWYNARGCNIAVLA